MKRISYAKQAAVILVVVATALTYNLRNESSASATTAQTALEAKIVFNVASQVGVRETGRDYVPGKPYGNIGAAWCANFVTWALLASGIDPFANGRSGLRHSYNVARAWAYYGAAGGGYGRWGSARDAMPGDLLIDRYNGTPSSGGHISVVVETHIMGQSHLVRTVGGNESNAVRNQIKDLRTDGRYLVTLAELRRQSVPIWGGGTVVFHRHQSGFGAILRVHSIWANNKVEHTPAQLRASAFKIQANHVATGKFHYFTADQAIATELYRNVKLVVHRRAGYITLSTLTHN